MLAFVSAIFSVVFFVFNSKLVGKMPAMTLASMLIVFQIIFQLLTMKIVDYDEFYIFSTDIERGVFGWVNSDIVIFQIFAVGFVSGFCGNCVMSCALLYYSPLVINNVFLLDPFGA
jgi:hypothetical protein